ncbi:siderophore-interacting protein [Rhodococcus tibetensis]|uniref:Siderophore-interacting protein n=1 Tax=Rhodococcus tibetensis TaxID=2965064 RepID=A0ABT1QIY1_9NOCA|nr:siderophore-interacting protein [Rhodococcus sp. FXJ9.536]MCQ4122216.1 siderophore-interacting protein [Rhodococcus sp. FXJ9.536]
MSTPRLPLVLQVADIHPVTPRMTCVRFAGTEVLDYAAGSCVPNIKLCFPHPVHGLLLPDSDADGRYRWPDPEGRQLVRTYTVRRLSRENAELDVHFVDHGDEGVAARWLRGAAPGDRLGVLGGGGKSIRPARWYLLAGDESALPAMSAILEDLPVDASGRVLIEVADELERHDLRHPAGVEVEWLYRHGGGSRLAENVRAAPLPADRSAMFAWVSAESATVRELRRYLRTEAGLDRSQVLLIGYWHRGMSESAYKAAADNDRDPTESSGRTGIARTTA